MKSTLKFLLFVFVLYGATYTSSLFMTEVVNAQAEAEEILYSAIVSVQGMPSAESFKGLKKPPFVRHMRMHSNEPDMINLHEESIGWSGKQLNAVTMYEIIVQEEPPIIYQTNGTFSIKFWKE